MEYVRGVGRTSWRLRELWDAKLHHGFRAHEQTKGLSRRGVMCRRGHKEADLNIDIFLCMLCPLGSTAQERCN